MHGAAASAQLNRSVGSETGLVEGSSRSSVAACCEGDDTGGRRLPGHDQTADDRPDELWSEAFADPAAFGDGEADGDVVAFSGGGKMVGEVGNLCELRNAHVDTVDPQDVYVDRMVWIQTGPIAVGGAGGGECTVEPGRRQMASV